MITTQAAEEFRINGTRISMVGSDKMRIDMNTKNNQLVQKAGKKAGKITEKKQENRRYSKKVSDKSIVHN